jgi:prepilin-type N-terminal cleavage/methylation domain-containing protein
MWIYFHRNDKMTTLGTMKRACKTIINHRGFTMIEMVMVLIVLVIVSTVIAYRPTTGSNDLIVQSEILKSHLRYVQIRAMNDTVTWGINIPDAGSYVLYKNNTQATSQLPGETAQTHALPVVIAITSGVGTTINFDEWGSPGTSTLTITLSKGTETSNITITKNTGYIP